MPRCPGCQSLCTAEELRPAYGKPKSSKRKVLVVTDDGPVFLSPRDADRLGVVGRDVWVKDENSKMQMLCDACITEARGKTIYTIYTRN